MNKIDLFMKYLCGSFDNKEQIDEQMKSGKATHPKAKHITDICNHKINNLPNDFKGFFVIEESYYEQGKFKNIMPHLFLFIEDENKDIVLKSYDLPKGISKEDLRNDNEDIVMDFDELVVSEKFNPLTYKFIDGGFEGESTSEFTPETTFKLKERIEDGTLFVSEVFEKKGIISFGCVEPIIYKRIK